MFSACAASASRLIAPSRWSHWAASSAMGTRSGRKIRYGHLLAAALDLTRIPAPLAGLLSAV